MLMSDQFMAYIWVKIHFTPLTREEFDVLKSHQDCDDKYCHKYGLVREGNIKTHSLSTEQGYGNCCKRKPFSIRKGTMFFGPCNPIDTIIKVLRLVASERGTGAKCGVPIRRRNGGQRSQLDHPGLGAGKFI